MKIVEREIACPECGSTKIGIHFVAVVTAMGAHIVERDGEPAGIGWDGDDEECSDSSYVGLWCFTCSHDFTPEEHERIAPHDRFFNTVAAAALDVVMDYTKGGVN